MPSIAATDPGLSRRLIHREENLYVHSKGYRKIALEVSGRDSRAMRMCGVPPCAINAKGATRTFAVGSYPEAAGAGNAAGVGGERVECPGETVAAEQPRQIIGIVGDVRGNGLDNDPGPAMYLVQAQVPDAINALNAALTPMRWIVRTRGNPLRAASAVQEQIRQVTGLPVTDVRTMDEIVSRSTSRQRFNMLLMTIFGGSALF